MAPRVLADAFAVLALATLSSVVVLVLAYLTVYGFSPWGLAGFTRTVGQVFDLPVSLGFVLKTLFFSLAVAVVPLAASLEAGAQSAPQIRSSPAPCACFWCCFCLKPFHWQSNTSDTTQA